MKVLITGGTGLIGLKIAERLLADGSSVTLFDRVPTSERITALSATCGGRLQVITGDVLDVIALAHAVRTARSDAIIHLAYSLGAESNADAPAATQVNITGTVNVLEVARLLEVPRVVMASSIAVYGNDESYPPDQLPVSEHVPLYTAAPLPIYGAGKIYLEKLAKHYRDQFGLIVVGLRPSIVYGWGRRTGATSFMSTLVEEPARGHAAAVGFGDALVSLVYVDDVAAQFIALLQAEPGRFTDTFFFNTGGDTCRVHQVADAIRRRLSEARIEVSSDGERDVHGLVASVSDAALVRTLGYERRFTPLDRALDHYIGIVQEAEGQQS